MVDQTLQNQATSSAQQNQQMNFDFTPTTTTGGLIGGITTTGYVQPVNPAICPHCHKCKHCGQLEHSMQLQSPVITWGPHTQTYTSPFYGTYTVGCTSDPAPR